MIPPIPLDYLSFKRRGDIPGGEKMVLQTFEGLCCRGYHMLVLVVCELCVMKFSTLSHTLRSICCFETVSFLQSNRIFVVLTQRCMAWLKFLGHVSVSHTCWDRFHDQQTKYFIFIFIFTLSLHETLAGAALGQRGVSDRTRQTEIQSADCSTCHRRQLTFIFWVRRGSP